MKCTMTLGQMTVGDHEVGSWPTNPMETIAAYLEKMHHENRFWIVLNSQPNEKTAIKTWYRSEAGKPVGEPCASITIFQE